jgi:Leucine-rich repeat (LRR) protein
VPCSTRGISAVAGASARPPDRCRHAGRQPGELQGLAALQRLYLSAKHANLEPLKCLTALQQLDLSGTHVANPEPLKGLIALQELNLADTPVANLEPLKGLTALQRLDLARTPVSNLEVDRLQQYRERNGLPMMYVQNSSIVKRLKGAVRPACGGVPAQP